MRASPVNPDTHLAASDAAEITGWLRGFKSAPNQAFITRHGKPAAADAMRQRMEREPHWSRRMPCYLESVSPG